MEQEPPLSRLLPLSDARVFGAMVPRYHSLFQQIGRIQGGVKFLVDMRADLLVKPINLALD